jgi:hypothetical protein
MAIGKISDRLTVCDKLCVCISAISSASRLQKIPKLKMFASTKTISMGVHHGGLETILDAGASEFIG